MATTKKSNTKAKSKKTVTKSKKPVESDYSITLDENENFVLDLYDRGKGKISAKLTCCDIFIVYGRVIITEDKDGDTYAFVSFPSFKNKDGDYISQAFFVDSDIVKEMNEAVTDYVNAD